MEIFHRQNPARLAEFPHGLLAPSTHDTKRSEDVRARIAALSELPEEWSRAVRRWHAVNRQYHRDFEGEPAPDANEEYLLYHTLLGAWPLEGLHDGNREEFTQRSQAYMEKALREAKVDSSWLEPNAAWDEAVREFIAAVLAPGGRNRFPQSIAPLAERIAQLGALNSLTQTVLKLTCSGVPDFYHGSELRDFSLVDPDHRRPVDYALRQRQLEGVTNSAPAELLGNWRDGRIKMCISHHLPTLRRERPDLFANSTYTAVTVSGAFAEKAVVFGRRSGNESVLVVVPRHTAALGFPPIGEVWADAQIAPPTSGQRWRDVFTMHEHAGENLRLADVLAALPVAVLAVS